MGIKSILWIFAILRGVYGVMGPQVVGAGTRLSQHHDMQLHKKICSCTDFIIQYTLN